MKTKNNTFAKREKYLLLIIALLGIFTAGWHFMGSALLTEVKTLHREQNSLAEEEKILLSILQDREVIEAEITLLDDQKERLDKKIPDLAKLPQALDGLEIVLNSHNLNVNSLRIGESSFKEDHVEVNLNLKVTGRPYVLQSLLQDIENLPNLVLFEKLKWSNTNKTDTTLELHLKKVFSLNDQAASGLEKIPAY